MKIRIFTGITLFVTILIVFWLDSYLLNYIILGGVLCVAFIESEKIYGLQDKSLVLIAMIFYLLAPFSNPVFIAIIAILIIVSFMVHFKSDNLRTVLPFVYPTTPIFVIWMLYSQYGVGYLAWLILTVVVCDSGAFFVGKMIGKHPFSPSSPNKTWEGVIGGIILASIFGTGYGWVLYDGFFHALLTSFLVASFGVWGDLFESYLKRQAGVKDSGNFLPGHGGMLDRIDGYLFGVIAMMWALSW